MLSLGDIGLRSLDPGGIDVSSSTLSEFRAALTAENRTLKRALTDPRILSGIGNAYSDEILHAAQLSPVTQTHRLREEEWPRLYEAARTTLQRWTEKLAGEATVKISEKGDGITSCRYGGTMAMGRFGLPCPRCGEKVRSAFAMRITRPTIAPRRQTGGKLLADRALVPIAWGRLAPNIGRVGDAQEALNLTAELGAIRSCRANRPFAAALPDYW